MTVPNPRLINPRQLRRLQTLYGQLAAHAQEGNDRAARLQWASDLVGRAIGSFSDLTAEEAHQLIDGLQGQMHMKFPAKRLDRDEARRAGTEGRSKGDPYATQPRIVSAKSLAVIENFYARLGWTRAQFDSWLASPTSPLKKKATPKIATEADANRVRWALKGMLQHRGLWEDRRPA